MKECHDFLYSSNTISSDGSRRWYINKVSFGHYKMWAITSPTSGGRSVGIVKLRTQATEFVFCSLWVIYNVQETDHCKIIMTIKSISGA
jgi:hypothetical protein